MNKETAIISVIIPVHNSEKTIDRTLASLISNREFIKEIIIVNDRCEDNTINRIEPFKQLFENIKIIDNIGNKGPGPARQCGLDIAEGKYVTFVDSDDCLTADCLQYVYIQLLKNPVVLYSQTIYYEFGSFNTTKDIRIDELSCGGNFYLKSYLDNHKIRFHDELFMSEDEYFNNKVRLFTKFIDLLKPYVRYFAYPVYEVHHDDYYDSFALSNWNEYACKYHLLMHKYLTDDLYEFPKAKEQLKVLYIRGFIFAYFILRGLIQNDKKIMEDNIDDDFVDAINYYESKFMSDRQDLIDYFEDHWATVNKIQIAANNSIGYKIKYKTTSIDFEEYIDSL